MEYYGDQWLNFDDIYESMNQFERITFIMQGGLGYTNNKYLAHVTGLKNDLMRQLAFSIGINKVYRSNPEKYKKIWANPNRKGIRITIQNNRPEPEVKPNHSYIG